MLCNNAPLKRYHARKHRARRVSQTPRRVIDQPAWEPVSYVRILGREITMLNEIMHRIRPIRKSCEVANGDKWMAQEFQNHAIPANIPTVKPSKHPLPLLMPPPSKFSTVPSPFPFFVIVAAALVATGATVEDSWVTVIEIAVGLARRKVWGMIPLVGTTLIAWLMTEGARGDSEISQRATMTERACAGELESHALAMQAMNGFSLFGFGTEEQMPKLDTWIWLLSLETSRRLCIKERVGKECTSQVCNWTGWECGLGTVLPALRYCLSECLDSVNEEY